MEMRVPDITIDAVNRTSNNYIRCPLLIINRPFIVHDIIAIRKHICGEQRFIINKVFGHIRKNEPAYFEIVYARFRIIQLRFLIVGITTIAERIVLAPCIVFVFYNKVAGIVKETCNIPCQSS